jgi:hypothetical protein
MEFCGEIINGGSNGILNNINSLFILEKTWLQNLRKSIITEHAAVAESAT